MTGKQISRKEFVNRALTAITGIGLLSKNIPVYLPSLPLSRPIGKTGITVSPICFGAPRTNEISLIKYALDKGINFIDTGRAYGNGNNEKLVGKAVSGIRNKFVIQTKIRLEDNELPSKGRGKKGAGEIRDALSSKFEDSLKALNTDYIDILLYHDALDESLQV
jgi:aryl-alcohol dehydrogenase-like predicted oxidoreductase